MAQPNAEEDRPWTCPATNQSSGNGSGSAPSFPNGTFWITPIKASTQQIQLFLVLSVWNSLPHSRDSTSVKLQHVPCEQPANSLQQGPRKTESNTRRSERNHSWCDWADQIRQTPCTPRHLVRRETGRSPPVTAQQLHPSSTLDSPVVLQQVSAMESSPAKIPLFFVMGKEALLESQIIQPETASCFGGLFIWTGWTGWDGLFVPLQIPPGSKGFPWGQIWLGNSACRFRESLRKWETRAREWIKIKAWSLPISWDKCSSL